ncbi:hypothetical protein DQX05_10750 [Paenibacillus thiaminolyticus]|uniref:Uncharacterized protein n=1 Tax=Paenibacillus thiaminolyticus TaxID=49283 RepID=A0A3A3GLA8_PANTH|nr:hypothetical protein DQX05_10750 [Paenibacillus thiaminolyticus]
MQIRANDVQAPKLRDLGILGRIPAAEHDVDAPAGHVRRDSDRRAPGPCRAISSASSASCFAFSTQQGTPACSNSRSNRSDSATLAVPTRIGRPVR